MLLAMAQAVPPAPRPASVPTIPRPCDAQDQDRDADIVVCGRRDDSKRYRLPPPTPYQSALPKAELKLGNGTSLSAETERVDIGGTPSNRAMIRLKFKF